ncbi:MAG: hypothetical protein WAX89_08055 [Alphaproteobacteria bacterium]
MFSKREAQIAAHNMSRGLVQGIAFLLMLLMSPVVWPIAQDAMKGFPPLGRAVTAATPYLAHIFPAQMAGTLAYAGVFILTYVGIFALMCGMFLLALGIAAWWDDRKD